MVLHRPQSAENVGAAARVMKNFGLRRLAIVEPEAWEGLPRSGGEGVRASVLERAARLARHASDLLEGATFHADLRDAVAGATWVCGTTSRLLPGRPRLSPRELAAEVGPRSRTGEVAVVFGEERRGLSDAELDLCQAVCTIPTSAEYDSMNLAQAVAVVSYELGLALVPAGVQARSEEPARHRTLEALWERLGALLGAAGYLNPQNPEHILSDWRRLLARAEPTQREVELLVAAVRALQRRIGRG
ncbi:MAG TPA: RNA methyltransferase [Anaeromyxobacteraceae bacterium]|nr:RNA methyltransferase [Anaeromyxobacteraceae bacterium]